MKLVVLAALAFVTLASSARADESLPQSGSATSKTIVLRDYIVYGRAARPLAVTEVTKLPMKTTVSDLRQPFVQRVEQAVQSKPF